MPGVVGGIIGSELGKHGAGFAADKLGLGNYKDSFQKIGSALGGLAGSTISPFHYGSYANGGKHGKLIFIEPKEREFVVPTKYVKEIPQGLKSKILKAKRRATRKK